MSEIDFKELKEKLCKSSKRTENEPYDEDTNSYVQKLFKCEPPCDSYGICSNCNDETIFHAGFNKGFDKSTKQSAAIINELIEIVEIQSNCMSCYSHENITHKMNACIAETTTRLQKLMESK